MLAHVFQFVFVFSLALWFGQQTSQQKLSAWRKESIWCVSVCTWAHILHVCMQSSSLEIEERKNKNGNREKDTLTLIEWEMFVV